MNGLKREYFKYISLNIMGMLGLSCYILADTYFVSNRMGTNGLAALNLAIAVYSLIHGTGLMIGIGGATRYTISRSQGKTRRASEAFWDSLVLGMAAAAFFMAAGVFGAEFFAKLLGANEEILPLTAVYLMTILCFSPCFILNNIVLAFVRNDGSPRLSMTGMICGSLGNIVLDYIFMYPLGWGMFGAAFATGLAPVISLSILSTFFIKKRNHFHLIIHRVRFGTVRDLCGLGNSAFINEVSSAVVLIVFNLLILRISGNVGVAAYGVVAKLALVAVAVFTGTAQGSQPLISKSYGKGEKIQVRAFYRYAAATAFVLGAFMILVVYMNTSNFVEVFNSEQDEKLAVLASEGLRFYFLGFFFAGINIVTAAYLGAVENARAAFFVAAFRGTLGILIFAVVLGLCFGMKGIWLSYPVTEGVTFLGILTVGRGNFQRIDNPF